MNNSNIISNTLNILKKEPSLIGWKLKCVIKNSYELFFIKQNLDMNRRVETSKYIVTIYTKEHDKIGKSKFQLHSQMSDDEIESKIKKQIKLCKFSTSNSYEFIKRGDLMPITKDISFDNHSLKEAAFIAADALFEADKYEHGYITSSEVFITHQEIIYYDSNDNVFMYDNVYGNIEFVVTWTEQNEEIELYKQIYFDHLDNKYIQKEADKVFIEAKNRVKATLTPNIENAKILITQEAVKKYFEFFENMTKVDNVYEKKTSLDIGSVLQQENELNDKITLKVEPIMKNSIKGCLFDDNGVILKRNTIIEKGIVRNLWGDSDKAQYLKKPVIGDYENFIVFPGTLSLEELKNDDYVEIVSFSNFEINEVTGDFGSEIRLGYYYQKGKLIKIITKGSISGNILDSLKTVRFLNESEQQNNFIGPKGVLLDYVKIMKGD